MPPTSAFLAIIALTDAAYTVAAGLRMRVGSTRPLRRRWRAQAVLGPRKGFYRPSLLEFCSPLPACGPRLGGGF